MTMAQVLYVLEIADCRSISAAAARLYLSQSALSQQVQRLEAELGYTLFSRTPRGLTLTPSGEKFCREARTVADTWRSFCGKVHPGGQSRKPLRVGLGARVYSNNLFQDVVRFFDEHPDIDVNFVTESGRDMLAGLRDGSIDFALDRLQAGDETGQDMFMCDLVHERQCLIMAQSDALASRERVAFRDLHGKTVISGPKDSAEDRTLSSICRKYSVEPGRIYRSDGIDTTMRLVRAGKGYAIGPESFGEYYQVKAVPVEPERIISLKFICMQHSLRREEIQMFRSYLCGICRERGRACAQCSNEP